MPKWRDSDEKKAERFGNYDKIRRKRQLHQRSNAHDPWEKPESEWVLGGDRGYFAARVVEVHKRYSFVSPEPVIGEIDSRDVWLATVARRHLTQKRGERNFVTVGDRVLCRPATDKDGRVESEIPSCVLENMAPRKSRVFRPDPMLPEREHVLAANIDQLVIVASYRAPKVRWALIDRYLVVAEEQDLPVTIVMTKEDLLDDEKFGDECRHHVDVFRSLGYRILSISMMERRRFKSVIQEIKELLAGKLTLLSGHSGVGKSSLVNLFKPEIVQEVEPEPDLKAKGRHTTTYASLIKLGTGGYVVDTPGVRSFAMLERTALEWSHGFREMRSRTGLCKFRECRHIDEPECAVLEAKERGEIDARRYQSYVNLVLGETGRQGRLRGQEVNEEEGVEEP